MGAFVACYLIVTAYALALGGLVVALSRMMSEIVASAISVIAGLAWLTWPIWLAEGIRSDSGARIASRLIEISPVFAMNGAMKNLGIWSERAIAYRITNLNQHVPYTLPGSILPCMLFHVALGAALLWVGSGTRRAFRSTSQIDSSASKDRST